MPTRPVRLAAYLLLGVLGCSPEDSGTAPAPSPRNPTAPGPQNSATPSPTSAPTTASRPGSGLASASFQLRPAPDWQAMPVRNGSPRKAQYRLPGGPSIGQPAELRLYFFGQGEQSSTEAKLDQWQKQMVRSSESPSPERQELDVAGFPVTVIEIQGAYREPSFGGPELPVRPDCTMLLAVIHTLEGDYFLHTVGDRSTLSHWRDDWDAMILGIRVTAIGPTPAPTASPDDVESSQPADDRKGPKPTTPKPTTQTGQQP